jgi:hypothetical protein
MEIQLCSNIFIFWLQVLKPIVQLYHLKIYKNIFKLKKTLLMLMAFLLVANGENSSQKNSYIINIIKISKKLDKVYNDFKD